MNLYPEDWPRCPVCDEPALDGHITCGRAGCDEGKQRRKLTEEFEYWSTWQRLKRLRKQVKV